MQQTLQVRIVFLKKEKKREDPRLYQRFLCHNNGRLLFCTSSVLWPRTTSLGRKISDREEQTATIKGADTDKHRGGNSREETGPRSHSVCVCMCACVCGFLQISSSNSDSSGSNVSPPQQPMECRLRRDRPITARHFRCSRHPSL